MVSKRSVGCLAPKKSKTAGKKGKVIKHKRNMMKFFWGHVRGVGGAILKVRSWWPSKECLLREDLRVGHRPKAKKRNRLNYSTCVRAKVPNKQKIKEKGGKKARRISNSS